jgi:hypothetical protein
MVVVVVATAAAEAEVTKAVVAIPEILDTLGIPVIQATPATPEILAIQATQDTLEIQAIPVTQDILDTRTHIPIIPIRTLIHAAGIQAEHRRKRPAESRISKSLHLNRNKGPRDRTSLGPFVFFYDKGRECRLQRNLLSYSRSARSVRSPRLRKSLLRTILS